MQVVAASGSYAPSTTYTIVNATGGVSGSFSNVSSNFAFLTPSLSYDANNVFLTLTTNFTNNSPNPTQTTVGTTLNGIGAFATGDMLTVLGALSLPQSHAGRVRASARSAARTCRASPPPWCRPPRCS